MRRGGGRRHANPQARGASALRLNRHGPRRHGARLGAPTPAGSWLLMDRGVDGSRQDVATATSRGGAPHRALLNRASPHRFDSERIAVVRVGRSSAAKLDVGQVFDPSLVRGRALAVFGQRRQQGVEGWLTTAASRLKRLQARRQVERDAGEGWRASAAGGARLNEARTNPASQRKRDRRSFSARDADPARAVDQADGRLRRARPDTVARRS